MILPTADDVMKLRSDGMSMHDARNLLMRQAVITALQNAKTFDDAREALIAIAAKANFK